MGVDQTCGLTNLNISSGDEAVLVLLTHNDVDASFNGVNIASPMSLMIEGTYSEDSFFYPNDNEANRVAFNVIKDMIDSQIICERNGDKIQEQINCWEDFLDPFNWGGIPSYYFKITSESLTHNPYISNIRPIGFMMMHKFAVVEAINQLEESDEFEIRNFKKDKLNKDANALLNYFHNYNATKSQRDNLTQIMNQNPRNSTAWDKAELDLWKLDRECAGTFFADSPWRGFGMASIFDSEEVVNTDAFKIIFNHLRDEIIDLNNATTQIISKELGTQILDFLRLFRTMLILRKQWAPQGHQSQVNNLPYMIGFQERIMQHMKDKREEEILERGF